MSRMKKNSATQSAQTGTQLAIDGGSPVRETPFAPWPHFDEEMLEAVQEVLRSGRVNYWTGEEARLFEQEYAEAAGTRYAVAVANGTVALEVALRALNIGPGDEVIVPCRTFLATASSVLMQGARPVFADIDANSQNITVETIEAVRTPRTKAVIAVHLAGWPCNMDSIMQWARGHDLKVIEDCAQAHGATYQGKPVGSMGDIAAFSFCQDKIISTGGEGGMVTTNDKKLWEKVWSFKDHGKSWDAVYNRSHTGVFKWLHESLGTNWRLTEMQAALGRLALQRLPQWIQARRRHADMLNRAFSGIGALRVTQPPSRLKHSYYKYYVCLYPETLQPGWTRDRIVQAIQAEGIPCGSGACAEIYKEEVFRKQNLQPSQPLPVAQKVGETSLMFPVHPTLSESEIRDMIRAIKKVLSVATTTRASSLPEAA